MAQARFQITVTNREIAALFWPAALAALRATDRLYSPAAWFLIARTYLALCFSKSTTP